MQDIKVHCKILKKKYITLGLIQLYNYCTEDDISKKKIQFQKLFKSHESTCITS